MLQGDYLNGHTTSLTRVTLRNVLSKPLLKKNIMYISSKYVSKDKNDTI